MFLYLSLLYCRYDFLQIFNEINKITYNALLYNKCVQKADFSDLEKSHVKFIFASRTTIVFHLVDYDLAVKRKFFDDENKQEGDIAVSVNHVNIMTTYIAFKQRYGVDHFQWLVMEYMNYELAEISKMENDTKISMCVSVCDALIYLHSRNIAHLDVKPSNVGATIINNDNNKKREIGLLHIYKTVETIIFVIKDLRVYSLIINKNYIKFIDPICKTNILLIDKFISYFYETNIDGKKLNITVNQTNDTSCDILYKLIDFDLSRKYIENKINTLDYETYGTYPDIAHELCKHRKFTLKTDVFNFGTLCYQLFHKENLNKEGENKTIVDYETSEQQENRKEMQNRRNDMDKIILSCIPDDPSARPELTAVKQDLQNYEQLQSLGNPLAERSDKIKCSDQDEEERAKRRKVCIICETVFQKNNRDSASNNLPPKTASMLSIKEDDYCNPLKHE